MGTELSSTPSRRTATPGCPATKSMDSNACVDARYPKPSGPVIAELSLPLSETVT